jgi:hypothetical protein
MKQWRRQDEVEDVYRMSRDGILMPKCTFHYHAIRWGQESLHAAQAIHEHCKPPTTWFSLPCNEHTIILIKLGYH